ncbi:Glucose/Sorbosone dehydrogenase [Gracilaria domingensis]|nr:Glucose/Sorbosone dehydrogenase [Gracilaria domingensis]
MRLNYRYCILLYYLLLFLVPVTCVKFQDPIEAPDHQAHAKPGGPYLSVDWNGDGMNAVTLDATQSHTHYFDHGPPPTSGSIVKYQWFSINSGAKILETASPHLSANFFLGVTILKLIVTDSTGDEASAYTYVQVREPHPGENLKPYVASIHPQSGGTHGGTVVTIRGVGFYNNPHVYFANELIRPHVISDAELNFRVPSVKEPQSVNVYITTGFGTSAQDIQFTYVASQESPIKFRATYVKAPDGSDYNIAQLTTFKLGPDTRYYAGSLNGFVHVLDIDDSQIVRSSCASDNAGEGRSILGLAFHPREHESLRLYISTSTLFWRSKGKNLEWDNGRIEIWSTKESECLSFERNLVTGLPVSANDHAVNNLVFTNDGALLVAIGGSTNAGVHTHGDKIGGIPESPLSGAILRFDLSIVDFDGNIKYSEREDPGTARVVSGTVEVFATGLRNVYGLARHSNGGIYGLDNGPNTGFGPIATGCNTAGRQEGFKDKLLHITEGSYYGHPNWNRARDDPRQCKFVRGDEDDVEGYSKPVATVESSTNGIVEYTANSFNSRLRGQLVLSKLSWGQGGSLKLARLDGLSALAEQPYELHNDSGLSVEVGLRGELFMPKVKQSRILAMVPIEPEEDGVRIITITPRRGVTSGGNFVTINGVGLDESVRIYFGGIECTDYRDYASDGRSVGCRVPNFQGGSKTVSVVGMKGLLRTRPSGHGEYEYMDDPVEVYLL